MHKGVVIVQSFVFYFTFSLIKIVLIRSTIRMVMDWQEIHAKTEHSAQPDVTRCVARSSSCRDNDYVYAPPERHMR